MGPMEHDPPNNVNSLNQMGVTDKKPYTAPELTVHGNVEEITKQFGSVSKDGLGGSQIE